MGVAIPRSRVLSYLALSASLLSVCAWIAIPAPVPFTLQTLAIFAVLGLLGGRLGTLAIVCYLTLGLVGLPVFAGFSAGPGVLLGATGGFFLGFILQGLVYWLITAHFGSGKRVMIFAFLLGLALLYAFGSLWFWVVYTGTGNMGFYSVLLVCVVPFIVPDLIKLALAVTLILRIRPQLRLGKEGF